MKKYLPLAAAILALGLNGSPAIADVAKSQAAAHNTYAAKGEIVAVDATNAKVKLKHEAVPELQWPGMTMDFAVADKAQLKGLKAGDKVAFRFALVGGQARITEIQRLK
ncbi:transporter [Novimethylophilus kurashikiensis]|uniref:Transporter n=1 Tax=Novimethylophilus kurashikiensis TaxID=1825523 RepID=A0A2R5F8W2_9PROT|nr:copper-binding protein [Novimethylophilus kurashikiensis]GBG13353.1 transporter [Novimethylophilus kurashikiensis]